MSNSTATASTRTRAATLILSLGLAFVFLWFGFDKLIRPIYWIGWIPLWMEGWLGLSRDAWLQIVGVIEAWIGLGILVPRVNVQRAFVVLAILHLLAVLTQTQLSDVGVRDVGLLTMAAALWVLLSPRPL